MYATRLSIFRSIRSAFKIRSCLGFSSGPCKGNKKFRFVMSYSSYSVKSSISEQADGSNGTGNAANCCSRASPQLKLYQAFIFSVPILFTFILLLLFYLFYLRRRRVDWSSLRMRTNNSMLTSQSSDDISRCELGLKKELREMLPIIVFKESFSVKDTQCSVCLGDYQADDRLQQIPACSHTFHMGCIDLWLTTHTTCPLCRQSLLSSTKAPPAQEQPDALETDTDTNETGDDEDGPRTNEGAQTSQEVWEGRDADERVASVIGERYTRDDEVERDVNNAK